MPARGCGQLPALGRQVLLQTLLAHLGPAVVAGALALPLLGLEGELCAGLGAGGPVRRGGTGVKKTPPSTGHTAAVAVGPGPTAGWKTLAPLVWLRQTVASSTGSQHRERSNFFLLATRQHRTIVFSSVEVLLVGPVVAEVVFMTTS